MRAIRLHPRQLKLVAVLAGVAMLTNTLVLPATRASASTNLVQASPTQGTVLAGTAFTDQLQVTGASGSVSFVQATASANVSVSPSGQVSAPSTLAPGTYSATGTDSDSSGDTGTWSYNLNVLQAAPQDFANTVVNVYQSEYSVDQQLGQASALEPASQYQQSLSQLTPMQLAELYAATQQTPGWAQIPSLMQTIASGIPPSGSAPASTATGRATTSTKAGSKVMANAATAASSTVAALDLSDCGEPTWSEGSLLAAQIVVDIAQGLFDVLIALDVSDFETLSKLALGIAAGVADAAVLAGEIAHHVMDFENAPVPECRAKHTLEYAANIDNTTVQVYALLTTTAAAITQLQTTENTTDQDVQAVQTQLTSVHDSLANAIASDTQTLQTVTGSDTQAVTTQLQTNLTALKQDVDSINTDQSSLSQSVINQVNTDSSQVQSALSSALSKILSETDTTAAGLTTLVTQNNQQVMNTLQANFKTQQSQHNSDLKIRVEKALAQAGLVPPPVQFILPASQGGYLNSTPVGVQEVVTDDLSAMTALGVKVPPSALTNFKTANTALAAGQYITAYQNYSACYAAFA